MNTRYDEGTYKSHLEQAKSNNIDVSLVLIQHLMLDIDTYNDIKFAVRYNKKPTLCQKISDLIN